MSNEPIMALPQRGSGEGANFDEIIPREGTDSIKIDRVKDECGSDDLIPMWVADMDFRTPPFVFDAIRKRLEQGILGYTCQNPPYYESICRWNKEQHGMDVTREMICYVPGVVSGIFLAVQAFTEKGDRILIQEPVYHPFCFVPESCKREVVQSSLRRTETSFAMDFEALRRDIKGCKMMILCNPHNPAGICWKKEDLQQVARICAEEGVVVVSDEIHCDMVFRGHKHIPFASVSEEARRISITLQAPTKTFNMPGIVASQAIVYDEKLRQQYFSYIWGTDQDLGNVFACDCVMACYSNEGREWKQQMLDYVQGNIDLVVERFARECPQIRPIVPEASFLVFLDCTALGFKTQSELEHFFAFDAKVGMNSGAMFGKGGIGFMRMNVGSPRSVVNEAIDRITKAGKDR